MRMLRIGLIAMVVSCLMLPALARDERPPTLARSYALQIKAGHEADFEAAMKKPVEWYKKNNETWEWHSWQWETGPNFGNILMRSPGHSWKDMDERGERSSRARAHFMEVVKPHLESISASIESVLPEVSHWPDDLGIVPLVSVYTYQLHTGMEEEFNHVIKRISEAIVKSEWPVNYAWGTTVNGGEVGNYWLVLPHKNWADMEGPDTPFWTMMEDTVGRQDADSLRESLKRCVREQHSALARFRPDLSYMPQ